ncbi:MAG: hypothetical protein KDK33_03870 [Leptospiraceae bacterium]|nr:hypothetical protein [Leptospiraceae bacterium]
MKLRFFIFAPSFVALYFLALCQPGANQRPSSPERQVNSVWQDRALFLAGLPASKEFESTPAIARILQSGEYQDHRSQMQGFWSSVERQRVTPMTDWWRGQLSPRLDNIESRVALYPLSGGDILNFKLMYPDAKRYIMIALEKPGTMPDPSQLSQTRLQGGLYSVRKMIGNIALTGYFFSRWMNQFMNPSSYGYYGTMPTVSVFLVRLGHRIQDIQEICIDEAGQPQSNFTGPCALPGYRIDFIDGRTDEEKDLIYLSSAIDNRLFSEDSPGGKFLRSQGELNVMMKAAVYLFHRPQHRAAAEYLLSHSEVIIQDDSGIPYAYFSHDRWNIDLYGTYLVPLPGMGVYPQRDLIEAYRKGAHPIPFEFGYGPKTVAKESGLMVAFRKDGK